MKMIVTTLIGLTLLFACTDKPSTQNISETEAESGIQDSIIRIENGLSTALQIVGKEVEKHSIESRLEHYQIPGVSIALAHNGEVLWSRAYGLADITESRKMSAETMLLAGSISKPVAALRALQLHDQGKFLLDENVNNYLTSWQVPDNEFTQTEKVTLRRLLNHSAGLTVWGFPGYDKGDDIPTTVDVLDGKGNTDAVRVYKTPGEGWQYSGGGYTVMQLAIADIEKAPFAEILQSHVLDPLNMNKSTFENPLPEQYHSLAATGYRRNLDEVEGKWPIYPEMAAAGLWTTPTQLLQYGIEVQRIVNTKQDGIITHKTALEMLTPGDNNHGLGPVVREHAFSHGGADEGFRAQFIAWTDSPYTAVVMVNSDNNAIIGEVLRSIATEYELPGYEYRMRTIVEQPVEQLQKFIGTYDSGEDGLYEVTLIDGKLSIHVPNYGYTTFLTPQGPTMFFEENNGIELEFVIEDEQLTTILWRGQTAPRVVE
ncbi:serine hydrolase domain-containing protein [Glaciecola petra]|uniref:Serine hydrolase domain-containing protein n=1 Tax=Glaciecola petra TaxID=3075602 RepID=A0ABU2ZUS9_9ALTE|nr:serine hydrolase domain-containing protein [Aestuariibacter sp. P117]MDT0596397.1 serine hydrolase domain-containing protein [Aestuariibacter sp. P117]